MVAWSSSCFLLPQSSRRGQSGDPVNWSTILHLIRHTANVRAQLMAVFERKKEALWIPYQVGAEFQRRRLDVQQGAIDAYDKLAQEMKSSVNQARNKLGQYRAHPVIDIELELTAL